MKTRHVIFTLFLLFSTSEAAKIKVVQNNYYACEYKYLFSEIYQIIQDGDMKAFEETKVRYGDRGLGLCISLKKGQKVYLYEFDLSAHATRIRLLGQTTYYWTGSGNFK